MIGSSIDEFGASNRCGWPGAARHGGAGSNRITAIAVGHGERRSLSMHAQHVCEAEDSADEQTDNHSPHGELRPWRG